MKKQLFKQASKTYYYATTFFPKRVQEDITILYAFVRVADDYVDSVPQQEEAFTLFEQTYRKALKGHHSHNEIIHDFVLLQKRKRFKQAWIDSFLAAMKHDLNPKPHRTLTETKKYMHGSAEVIGLMISNILELPKKSAKQAQLLGRAMQYINFLRDINEDNQLGRQYIPTSILKKHGLKNLRYEEATAHPEAFTNLIRAEIMRYQEWDDKAREGFTYIPKRYRVAIQTAADMYRWTAQQIFENPFIIYKKKVKPSKARIISTGLKNTL